MKDNLQFNDLPLEILVAIFYFLPAKDILSCALLSKAFYPITQKQLQIIKKTTITQLEQSIDKLQRIKQELFLQTALRGGMFFFGYHKSADIEEIAAELNKSTKNIEDTEKKLEKIKNS